MAKRKSFFYNRFMSTDEILSELSLYLRPPGLGIHAVSAGKEAQERWTQKYLGVTQSIDELKAGWIHHLAGIPKLSRKDAVVLLGAPSDTGAGIMRGANRGPQGVREALGKSPCFDAGDIFCIPHFLDEESLRLEQRLASQLVLYPDVDAKRRTALPVSPLGMGARAYALIRALNPRVRIQLIGGDHTMSHIAMENVLDADPAKNSDVAILHFDAHTDLMPSRLGVRICFATWAYHANERLGRGQRLVQLGIRVTAKPKDHWESTLKVKQFWSDEAKQLGPEKLANKVVEHLKKISARRIYISNDIDGTDPQWASACGTPEADGLTPDHVTSVINAVTAEGFEPLGADVVEVAPSLSLDRELSTRTIETAALYCRAQDRFLRG